ncbi:hypothetical protein ACT6NV_04995 [Robiginitalea sp. IMCC44478]|uniref:hypothetical protein n=1 Tax=Robiginitalea sp. IMCC44478 TaxID=3459122 RepID=UPI0040427EE5
MQDGILKAEELYNALDQIIPPDFPLDSVIIVQLNGNIRSQTPYVDGEGTIQLWRYPAEEGGYWALFAHELVHAIAFDAAVKAGALEWESLGFYNEGWAEYASRLIDPAKTGFPFYGFDETVVAGYWASQEGPTLAELRNSHEELNLACACQTYPLRASWFRYVDETYGREAVLEIMYGGREMTPEVVAEILGDSLSEVDRAWRAWVLKGYALHPKADARADAYLNKIGCEPCL